jgi:dynein light chain Tctex-type 1
MADLGQTYNVASATMVGGGLFPGDKTDKAGGAAEEALNADDVRAIAKNMVAQVLEEEVLEEGGQTPPYSHAKAAMWVQKILETTMEKLVRLRKPYKYVLHVTVARKVGAGLHVANSCYFSPHDGSVTEIYDASEHLFCSVTVFWTGL